MLYLFYGNYVVFSMGMSLKNMADFSELKAFILEIVRNTIFKKD